jgi:hypothetical protein
MSQATPKQIVTNKFGTRQDLVNKILPLIGGSDAERSRLMGTTNAKLLRIHEVAEQVKQKFGGKGGLIDAIAKLQFAGRAANAGWREKMEGFTVKRLADKYRQLGGK